MKPDPPHGYRQSVRTLFHVFMGILIAALIVAVVGWPLVADRFMGDGDAYNHVLRLHRSPHYVRYYKRALQQEVREPCLLYLSWFPDGKPRFARTFSVCADGATASQRIMWNYATRGGSDAPITDRSDLSAIRQLAALPPGLKSPDDVSYGRLLIVTSGQREPRLTRYYDRAHLPPPVRRLVHLLDLRLGERYPMWSMPAGVRVHPVP